MLLVCFGAFTKFVLLLLVRDATNTATIYALKQKILPPFQCLRSQSVTRRSVLFRLNSEGVAFL